VCVIKGVEGIAKFHAVSSAMILLKLSKGVPRPKKAEGCYVLEICLEAIKESLQYVDHRMFIDYSQLTNIA